MKILITGGNGYLGNWVRKELEAAGHEVVATGSRQIYVWKDALRTLDRPDCVVHLAWYAKAGNGQEDVHKLCLGHTRYLADWLQAYPECRVVFSSTLSVYGPGIARPSEETGLNPNCDYTMGKVYAENFLQESLGDRAVILRLGSLMGRCPEREKTDLVVNAFASDAYTRGRITCWNPGAWKPYIHVKDATLVVKTAVEDRWNGIWNVAAGCMTAGEIARMVQLQTGCDVDHEENEGEQRSCRPDCDKFEKLMGKRWRGLLKTIAEFKDYRPSPSHRTDPARWGSS